MNYKIVFIVGLMLAAGACKKSDNPKASNTLPTVYVVGISGNSALYWKNGTQNILNSGASSDVNVASIFASATNIYVAGKEYLSGNYTATLWKNNVPEQLPNESGNIYSSASSVTVSGEDVYAAGYSYGTSPGTGTVAIYWKNQVPVYLSAPGQPFSEASSISVSGSDIYVAGASVLTGPNLAGLDLYAPALWKNGNLTILAKSGEAGNTTSVSVNNGDVYVTGYQYVIGANPSNYNAVYWKNGVMTQLSANNALAYAIAVSGNDVYVAGDENINGVILATIWKNGTATHLTGPTVFSTASAIAVSGTNVYVAGNVINSAGATTATLWKNGAATNLGAVNSNAYGIYLK